MARRLLGCEEIVVISRPQAIAAFACRHIDPGHRAALLPESSCQPVDVGHDGPRGGDLGHIKVLHVNHDESRAYCLQLCEHLD